jgi:hypothetical protein
VGRPGGKRPFGRRRHRREDNNKVDHYKMGWGGTDWIAVARDRDWWRAIVDAAMNLRVP